MGNYLYRIILEPAVVLNTPGCCKATRFWRKPSGEDKIVSRNLIFSPSAAEPYVKQPDEESWLRSEEPDGTIILSRFLPHGYERSEAKL